MVPLTAGNCIRIETNKDRDGCMQKHIFVLLFDALPHQSTIIVPICTRRSEKHDKTVILQPGDYEHITSTSYIHYNLAKIVSTTTLVEMIQNKAAELLSPPIGQELLNRIREGVRKSKGSRHDILSEYGYKVFR